LSTQRTPKEARPRRCGFCGEEPETPHHILLEFYVVRHRRSPQLAEEEIPRTDPLKIRKFLKELNLEELL